MSLKTFQRFLLEIYKLLLLQDLALESAQLLIHNQIQQHTLASLFPYKEFLILHKLLLPPLDFTVLQ